MRPCLCAAGRGDARRGARQQPADQEEVLGAQQPLEEAGGEDGRQGGQAAAGGAAGAADGAAAGEAERPWAAEPEPGEPRERSEHGEELASSFE